MNEASQLIRRERERQIEKGLTPEKDRENYKDGQLLFVARSIWIESSGPYWPSDWSIKWYHKFMREERLQQLVIAGALIVAHSEAFNEMDAGMKGLLEEVEGTINKLITADSKL